MQPDTRPGTTTQLLDTAASQYSANPRDALNESFLSDSVLNELKRQSAGGCVLCSLEV